MNERKKYAQLQVINEGAKLSEVREAPIEPAETKKDKNKKNIYLHLIRFLIRSDELINRSFGRSGIGWRWQCESRIVAYRPFLTFFPLLVDWNARLFSHGNLSAL